MTSVIMEMNLHSYISIPSFSLDNTMCNCIDDIFSYQYQSCCYGIAPKYKVILPIRWYDSSIINY